MEFEYLKESIAKPFPGNPSGSDPKYHEDFLIAKREIEKLSGTNYALVQHLSQKILLEQSKDLRTAGYLVLANSFLQGISGFIEGLKIYENLLEKFWKTIYPQKPVAKLNTIKWLNNPRLIAYITERSPTLHEVTLSIDVLQKLNSTITGQMGQDFRILQSLEQWLLNKQKMLQVDAVIKSEKNVNSINQSEEINSNNHVDSLLTKVIQWCSQQKFYVPAAAYVRALRWANLQLPPHENYLTRLSPPRVNGLVELQNLIKSNNSESIFLRCEALLLEPSYHLYLDLQRYAWDASKAMGDNDLCIYLQTELLGLLQRFPELTKLQFADGMPFVNSNTILWLEELTVEKNVSKKLTTENKHADFFILEAKRNTNNRTSLAKLLNNIVQITTSNTAEEFQKKYAIAKLCLEYKRSDLAVPIFEELFKLSQTYCLSYWNIELVTALWYEHYQALEFHLKRASENNRGTLSQRLLELKQLICQNDTVKAVTLFKI